ncbi:hypothetical protein ACFXGR_34220 [Streptomyces mirabilis]|uniref:hypothetical protein n=1 Tax=Streptomyces mirabilis TaxID=68239 RepID=UPI0036683554
MAVLSIQAGSVGGVAVGVLAGAVTWLLGRVAVPPAPRGIVSGGLVPLPPWSPRP